MREQHADNFFKTGRGNPPFAVLMENVCILFLQLSKNQLQNGTHYRNTKIHNFRYEHTRELPTRNCPNVGKDKSVISRELKRNSDSRSGTYRHELAERPQTQASSFHLRCGGVCQTSVNKFYIDFMMILSAKTSQCVKLMRKRY